MTKATELFRTPGPARSYRECPECGRHMEPEERVLLRVCTYTIIQRTQKGLESKGITFCAECARSIYDDFAGRLEAYK